MTEQNKIVKVEAFASAKKEKVVEKEKDFWQIFVKEPAQKNLANKRIIAILSELYQVPVNKIRLLSGAHSQKKRFEINK